MSRVENMEKLEPLYIAGGHVKMAQLLLKNNLAAPQKVKYRSTIALGIPLLVMLEELKQGTQTNMCMSVLLQHYSQ